MHLFLSLRALRSALACGSEEENFFSPYPGFREPAIAICNRRTRSTLGYPSSVPTALSYGIAIGGARSSVAS